MKVKTMGVIDFDKPNILILTGDSGSGKSTIADTLTNHPELGHLAVTVSFGHYLRVIVDQQLRQSGNPPMWDLSRWCRARRDKWERETGYKDLMIRTGDQIIARHPLAFITPVIDDILEMPDCYQLVVVPDCRSPMELAALQHVGNVWGVRLLRDGAAVKKYDDELKYLNLPLIDNNGTPEDTIAKISVVLRSMPNT